MTPLTRAHAWQVFAACRTDDADPDLWYSDDAGDQADAHRVCAGCPVLADCLDHALTLEGPAPASGRYGIVAGLGPHSRRRVYEERVTAAGQTLVEAGHGGRRQRAACGTEAARRRHLRAGEACLRCGTPRPEPQPTPANARRDARQDAA